MTFSAFETAVEASRPIELYTIVVGAETFRYTSAEDTITIGGLPYTPVAISRGKLSQGPEEANRVVEVELPGSNTFALKYVISVPSQRAKLTLSRVQRPDFPGPQVITLFEGYVKSVSFSNNGRTAKLAVLPAISAASRSVPRYTYQGSCNNVLYDVRCQVDSTNPAYRLTGTVTAVVGNVVTVFGANGITDGWFDGGSAEALGGTDARLILSHIGNDVTLLLPFPYALVGQPLILLAGCKHIISVCKSKFDNVINYGGFSFVPTNNPFDTGIAPVKC